MDSWKKKLETSVSISGRRGGLMFGELVSGSNSPGSKPGWELCIVLLVKTRYLNSQ